MNTITQTPPHDQITPNIHIKRRQTREKVQKGGKTESERARDRKQKKKRKGNEQRQ